MSWLQAVLLGLLQGLTEFLPVSSTAHMDIVPQLFGQKDPGAAFSAIAQLGPIVAIILYFRNDLLHYIQGILRNPDPRKIAEGDTNARLGWYTLLGTIPLIIFALALEKYIDRRFRSLDIVAASLIILALVLLWAERIGKQNVSLEKMSFRQSFNIGLAQVLGLVPGASRSGVTITAGLLQGLDRESAARFSFLLSIPAITLAGLYKLLKAVKAHQLGDDVAKYVLAAVVAGVFAYAVINWFLGYMKNHNTGIFIVYRIALGVAILILFHTGTLHEHPVATDTPPTNSAPAVTKVFKAITIPAASKHGVTSPSTFAEPTFAG